MSSSAASVTELASRAGIPLSTTHTINTAIVGAVSAKRFSLVRWSVFLEMVVAWLLTFPVCGAIAYAVTWALNRFLYHCAMMSPP